MSHDTPSKEVWSKINSIKKSYKSSTYPIKINGQHTDHTYLKANKIAQYFQNISTIKIATPLALEINIENKI